MTVFSECAAARAFRWLRDNSAALYENSVLGRMAAAFRKSYPESRVRRGWEAFVRREGGVEASLYGRSFAALHRFLNRCGLWLLPALHASVLYRAGSAVKRFFHRLFYGSLLYKAWTAAKMDFHRLVIVFFSLYLPVDWLLRDILSVSVLASVWDELFFLAACVYVVWLRVSEREWDGRPHVTALDMPILLFCCLGFFLMCVNAPVPSIAVAGLRATVQYMLWFFVMARLLRNEGDVRALCGGIAAVGLAMALHGIYQFIAAVPIPDSWTTQTEADVRTRAFSITGSPNILGAYFVLTAPLFAGFAYTAKKPFWKLCAWGAVGVEMLALLATYSKGAWVGMVCAVLLFAILYDRKIFALLGIGVSGALFVPSILSRIQFLFTDDFAAASAVGGRSMRWALGRELLAANPWLGFGLGRFGGAVAMQNQYLEVTEEFQYFYLDNYYLKIAVEMGYPGIIAFVFLMAALLWQGLRAYGRTLHMKLSPLAAGILSGLFGVMMHCLFENIFEEPYMMALFWGLAAALVTAPRWAGKGESA
ncbi:MAG: O-antigen ligase family protein [Eubacteriales bacterium]|nr:O-antigen ligase family protein [Eubacteriales bacterium]